MGLMNMIDKEIGKRERDEAVKNDAELQGLINRRRKAEDEAQRIKMIREEKQKLRSAQLEKYRPALRAGKSILTGIKKATNKALAKKSGTQRRASSPRRRTITKTVYVREDRPKSTPKAKKKEWKFV